MTAADRFPPPELIAVLSTVDYLAAHIAAQWPDLPLQLQATLHTDRGPQIVAPIGNAPPLPDVAEALRRHAGRLRRARRAPLTNAEALP